MFYSQFILAKKGPLGTIWIAAHLERKLKKNQVADTDIGDSVDSILFPDVPIALRLSSHLLLGVVRIYSKKVNYLFHDCSETLLKVKQAFRSTAVDLPPEESTAPYHSITLPETFDLDDFELPDTVGNNDDRNVSTKEQITLQDALDGAGFSNLQFGLDERFGDGDASQIGLDFEEEFLRDSSLMFQQVKEGVFQHGEGSSEFMKINDNEEQASHDKENNNADSNELSKLLGGDRGKSVITNIQNVNKNDEFSHRLMFNIRTPDLNEVFMPDDEFIGGPSRTHDIDMDHTSPEFIEPNNLPITPMVQEVAMVLDAECADAANDNILNAMSTNLESDNVVLNEPNSTLNELPMTPMVQEGKWADAANDDIINATLTTPESNTVVLNEANSTLNELPATHMDQEVQCAVAANDTILNAISTNPESDSVVLNEPNSTLDDLKIAENTPIPVPINVTDPILADGHVLQFSDSTVATPGLIEKELDSVAANALPNGVVCSEVSNHVVSSINGIPTLNHAQIEDVNSVQTNHNSFSNSDFHLKSCTSVSNQANLVSPGEPYCSVTPTVDKDIQFRELTMSVQGPPSDIAINTNTEAHTKLNDGQLDQLNHIPSSEAPEPERLLFTPAINFTPSNDQNMHFSQGPPSDIAINTNTEAQPKLKDGQLDQLNHIPSFEAPEPERLLFTPAINFTPSNDQNMHFSQDPPSDIAINTNTEAQPKLNDDQLDQLNHIPSSEAPEPERLLFAPAINFTPSNDQNMHFSQGPHSNIAINTNTDAQPKLNDVQLHQLNHIPNSEAPEPERLLFTPAVNFTPSNDQNLHFSQGMHFTQNMHFSHGMQFSQDMHFRGPSTNIQGFPSDNATVTNRELFAQPKSNEHTNQLNYMSNSQFSEPERMLFASSVNYFAPNDIEKQPVNKGVIEFDGSIDRTGTLSGKKRPLTDNTPYILNDTSFNMSAVLQKRQHNDYIIPQDDDLLASILVGRTPALKVGPSPPIPKPPTSKRPRLTQKSGLPKRRKVLLDDPIVLHADTIRQQLINTDDIHRLRKKVPCTIPEIWRLQRNLLEEGEEEKDIFGGSIFTGISQKLISLNTRKYASVQKLPEHGISHDSTIEVIKEFGGNKSPVSVMDNNGPEIVTPNVEVSERVNVSEIVTPNVEVSERVNMSEIVTPNVEVSVEVSERVNMSEIVTPNVEVSERVNVLEIVTPNVEVSERVNLSEIVTPNVEVAERVSVSEIVTPNVEVLERVNVLEIVTPIVEVSERVDIPELVDTEKCNNLLSVETQEPHNVDLPESNTSNAKFCDNVIEEKCDELNNDLLLGAPDMPVTVNDDMPHHTDLSNDKATEITVEDMVVDVVSMAEVGSEFKEYASYIVGEANSLDPDLHIIEGEHAASAMDENLSVNVEAGLDVGNNHIEHEPTKESNGNLSVNVETDLDVESNHIEQAVTKESDGNLSVNVETGFDVESNHIEHAASKESDENLSMDVETGRDVENNHIEQAATKESDDFHDDIDNIDTDFLNVDDDVEYDEDTTTDVQNADDTQSSETVGWSSRTRGVANYLKIMFDQESGRGRKSVAIDQLLAGKTRKEASRMFFETLVLKTRDYIQVEQETPFAYINVQPRMKLLKSEF